MGGMVSGAQGYFYTMQPKGPNGTFECGPRPEVRVCLPCGCVRDMGVLWGGGGEG